MSDDYKEQRFITVTKTKKDQGKFKRFIVNPMMKVMGNDEKKKDRLTA